MNDQSNKYKEWEIYLKKWITKESTRRSFQMETELESMEIQNQILF